MTRAIVTGATGFLGPFAVRALRERFPDLPIRCLVRAGSDTTSIGLPGVTTVVGDLRQPHTLDAAFADADVLVNLASLGFDWNGNVIAAAKRARIGRAIFVSTTAILTRLPVASKPIRERGEQEVRDSGLAWTILRPTMIYGTARDRNVARLIRLVDRLPVVPLIAPDALQQPIHVADVAWAVAAALASPATVGRAYNLSGQSPLTMRAMMTEVAGALGRRRALVPLPLPLLIGLVSVWRTVARPPISVEQLRRIDEDKSFDHADARRDFGFTPRSFRDGLRAEVEEIRQEA
jgi:uncharacterized protein YbjT (DUF2867 family)